MFIFDSWCRTIQGSREGFQNLLNPRKTRLQAGFLVLAFRGLRQNLMDTIDFRGEVVR